jgi:hypothetical protein
LQTFIQCHALHARVCFSLRVFPSGFSTHEWRANSRSTSLLTTQLINLLSCSYWYTSYVVTSFMPRDLGLLDGLA